jgi:hypothetical protein
MSSQSFVPAIRAVSDPKVADEVLEQGIQNARMFLG